MKEEDLSVIKRYPIVEYLERKGIKPVRRTPAYAMYRSPLRAETHPSFKVEDMSRYYKDFKDLNEYHVYRVRKKQIRQGQIQDTSIKATQVKHKMR